MTFGRLLTVLFGALPATWLGIFALVGMWWGLTLLFANLPAGDFFDLFGAIVLLAWGGLGIYGAISLWAIGLGFVSALWMRGLSAGLIAVSPVLFLLVLSGDFMHSSALPALLPAIVACTCLYKNRAERNVGSEENVHENSSSPYETRNIAP